MKQAGQIIHFRMLWVKLESLDVSGLYSKSVVQNFGVARLYVACLGTIR
jgi:hypothetical protein